MILLMSLLAFGSPKYKNLKEGECAPFDGRLLNDDALSELIITKERAEKSCQIRIDYEVNRAKINEKYRYDVLKAKYDAETTKYQELISLRDKQIESLEKRPAPMDRAILMGAGFVFGAAATIGIVYAVKPGVAQ